MLLGLVLLGVSNVFAGGPIYVNSQGVASAWDNASAISFHPESGDCGPFSNAEMITKMEDDLSVWADLEEVDLEFSAVEGSLGLVDSTNYTTYYYTGTTEATDLDNTEDDINPVVFDEDAEITASVAGEENKYLVLGFASIVGFNDDGDVINDGQVVINCRCIEGNESGSCTYSGETFTFTETQLDATIVHEMGHFLNLDHSQVNIDLYDNGDTSDDVNLPIMFPVISDTALTVAVTQDDVEGIASLYPSSSVSSTGCWVTGDLLDVDGNELRCADVWATTSDDADTVSFVSGTLAVAADNNSDGDTSDSGECESGCGYFQLFLSTGKDYTLTIQPIYSGFVGGSGMGPCFDAQLSTIKEEVIDAVSSSQCTGGTTLYLGEFTTTSTGGVGSNTTGTGGGSSSTYDSQLNPVGYWCSLSTRDVSLHRGETFLVGYFFFLVVSWMIARVFEQDRSHASRK